MSYILLELAIVGRSVRNSVVLFQGTVGDSRSIAPGLVVTAKLRPRGTRPEGEQIMSRELLIGLGGGLAAGVSLGFAAMSQVATAQGPTGTIAVSIRFKLPQERHSRAPRRSGV